MIAEEKLAELRNWQKYAEHKFNGQRLDEFFKEVNYYEFKSILDTLSALWRVARRAENYINCVPAICNDECVDRLKEALAALRSEEKK